MKSLVWSVKCSVETWKHRCEWRHENVRSIRDMATDEERKNQLGIVAKLIRHGWKWGEKR